MSGVFIGGDMTKNDYYVIVYKILAYLYVRLKEGKRTEPEMIIYNGKLFAINEAYWKYIIVHLYEGRYIENITVTKSWGGDADIQNLEYMQITPLGIEFLCNNNLMEKAKGFLKDIKDIKDITPFI